MSTMPRAAWALAAGAVLCLAVADGVEAQEIAYAWADQPTANSYTPAGLYSFNPKGDVRINRRDVGLYDVSFMGFGRAPSDRSGIGGHVQVSAYRTTDRCNIRAWGYEQPDFRVSVMCFKAGTPGTPTDAVFTVAVFAPRPQVAYMMPGTPEIDALQAEIQDLQQRVSDLENP